MDKIERSARKSDCDSVDLSDDRDTNGRRCLDSANVTARVPPKLHSLSSVEHKREKKLPPNSHNSQDTKKIDRIDRTSVVSAESHLAEIMVHIVVASNSSELIAKSKVCESGSAKTVKLRRTECVDHTRNYP